MKTIKIKIVDKTETERMNSCFGENQYKDFVDILLEVLSEEYNVEFSDNPQYVFSILPVGMAKGYEYYRYSDCVQCQIILENVKPDFNCFDYAIGSFHDFSFESRFLYLPATLMCTDQARNAYKDALVKHEEIDDSLCKRKFCSFVVSNGKNAAGEREAFFRLLNEYKKVDSGGRFLNNVGGPVKDRVSFEREHKFSIVFENSWQSQVTEKIDMAFAAKTVPIYWGNPRAKEIYNEGAFIDCNSFESFEDVVQEVLRIDRDDEIYLQYLKTPAYKKSISSEEYRKRLKAFLKKMIETPRSEAIIRSEVGWNKKLQVIRYRGFRRDYAKRVVMNCIYKTYSCSLGRVKRLFFKKEKDSNARK